MCLSMSDDASQERVSSEERSRPARTLKKQRNFV